MAESVYSRYRDVETLEVDGRITRVLRVGAAPDGQSGIVHVLVAGETLDLLAKRYYGEEELWWRIADANPRRFPLDWQPGDEIVVPPLSEATDTTSR